MGASSWFEHQFTSMDSQFASNSSSWNSSVSRIEWLWLWTLAFLDMSGVGAFQGLRCDAWRLPCVKIDLQFPLRKWTFHCRFYILGVMSVWFVTKVWIQKSWIILCVAFGQVVFMLGLFSLVFCYLIVFFNITGFYLFICMFVCFVWIVFFTFGKFNCILDFCSFLQFFRIQVLVNVKY